MTGYLLDTSWIPRLDTSTRRKSWVLDTMDTFLRVNTPCVCARIEMLCLGIQGIQGIQEGRKSKGFGLDTDRFRRIQAARQVSTHA